MKKLRTHKVFGFIPLISLLGAIIGLAGGYAYYYYIGCRTGSCPITNNPWLSLLWGGALGYLIFDIFYKRIKPDNHEHQDQDS